MHNLILFLILCLPITFQASNLKIEAVEWHHETNPGKKAHVRMTISWDNAWHNDRNHDAAWVVIKLKHQERRTQHLKIASGGHRLLANQLNNNVSPKISVPADGAGFFIHPSKNYHGHVSWTIQIELDSAILNDNRFRPWEYRIRTHGVEMVYIPAGGFTLGDPDTVLIKKGALFASDGDGKFGGLFKIENERSEINISTAKGDLFYQPIDAYMGDQKGPIPAEFPKGVQAFYIMKYELRQGQYADFLNALTNSQSQLRANFGGKNYYQLRGTITLGTDQYQAAKPDRPCNFLSWDDAMAYADWAGLRPLTELEFTKACRGPLAPAFHERPWGAASKDQLARHVSANGDLAMTGNWNESQMSDSNRAVFGASYYWVMDLAGSLWERVVTIGDDTGRKFTGQHGDGRLTGFGFANVEGWPQGVEEEGGYGFRGGGYYEQGRHYHDLNPHAPVAQRRYGSWSGGNRAEAYGSRFVRTAE
ncbi:MAG: SUMF1/EgtB/PvdO family nonheme iron enzyme [Bacteroidota bacterium]